MVFNHLVWVRFCCLAAVGVGALHGCGRNLKTYEGDVYIDRADQIEEYRGYGIITGRVTIAELEAEAFSWPELVEIGGELWIWENSKLKGFNLAGLEKVGLSVLVRNNSELVGINMSSLSEVGGSFAFAYNSKLPSCQVHGVVASVGSNKISGETSVVGNNDNGLCQ